MTENKKSAYSSMPERIYAYESRHKTPGGICIGNGFLNSLEFIGKPENYTEYVRADLVPQWQPIETCPKPSGQVLLATKNSVSGFSVFNGHWFKTGNRFEYDCHFAPNEQPSYWMPLPKPPKENA